MRLFGWLFFLSGAFGDGLTDSDENKLKAVVVRGLWAVGVETTSSLASLFRTVLWANDVAASGSMALLFRTGVWAIDEESTSSLALLARNRLLQICLC